MVVDAILNIAKKVTNKKLISAQSLVVQNPLKECSLPKTEIRNKKRDKKINRPKWQEKKHKEKKHCEETFSLGNIESRLALVSDIS